MISKTKNIKRIVRRWQVAATILIGVHPFAPLLAAHENAQLSSGYMHNLEQDLRKHWQISSWTGRSSKVAATFKIKRGGEITGLRIKNSSGSAAVDNSVLKAIVSVVPFPPLPRQMPSEIVIEASFVRGGDVQACYTQ